MVLMSDVSRDHVDSFIIVYLEDILTYSNNREGHVNYVRISLEKLRHHK